MSGEPRGYSSLGAAIAFASGIELAFRLARDFRG
jgi:hypothetical protein